ncbi:FAD/NAD(P)-binding protein [Streptomyces caniferus]|uniref:FAD/NAD(P)-binding protein n=1 Tax=Streptomyces caniferus TaxID=285557 RepID=UPI003455ED07
MTYGSELPDHRHIVVVGAGPRGIGIVERLTARRPRKSGTLHLVDPHLEGGRIWRPDQSPLLWMNSRCADITMFPDRDATCTGPVVTGPTLYEWATSAASRSCGDAAVAAEAAGLAPGSYASRRLCGAYLTWCLHTALSTLPAGWNARLYARRADRVSRQPDGTLRVHLDDGRILPADRVVLAMGNLEGPLTPEQRALGRFAADTGAGYLAPDCAADLDLGDIPGGGTVLVRGMGLAFLDVMALLTEGRGGSFHRDTTGVLRYEPSGSEPLMVVSSRRGLPLRPRPVVAARTVAPDKPVFLTGDAIADLVDRMTVSAGEHRRTLVAELWNAVGKEMAWGHYRELFTTCPDAADIGWEAFAGEMADAAPGTASWSALGAHIGVPEHRFVLPDPHSPGLGPMTGADELAQWMSRTLARWVARATDPRHSTDSAAHRALVRTVETIAGVLTGNGPTMSPAARGVLDRLTRLARTTSAAVPCLRIEQLAALAREGTVRFAGARPEVGASRQANTFTLRTGTLPTETFAARHLIDAWIPDSDVVGDRSGLLARMTCDGLARAIPGATPVHGAKIATCPDTYQVLDAQGRGSTRIVAVGDHASAGALGALSRPGTDAAFFRQNDIVASRLLDAAALHGAPPATTGSSSPAEEGRFAPSRGAPAR